MQFHLNGFKPGNPEISELYSASPPADELPGEVDVLIVGCGRELRIEAMPSFLLPRKGRYGLRDYEKMFCPDLKDGQDIFATRGVDRNSGCMVVVRSDQYVAHILPLDAYAEVAAFFDAFMI